MHDPTDNMLAKQTSQTIRNTDAESDDKLSVKTRSAAKENNITYSSFQPQAFNYRFGNIPGNPAPLVIQAKLAVSTPGDIYEQEADATADKVMRKPSHPDTRCALGTISSFQPLNNSDHCDEAGLQRKEDAEEAILRDRILLHNGSASAHFGTPLSASIRQFFEPRFGVDFSDVRIHNNERAAAAAQSIGALAYTSGNNIVFGRGQFVPETQQGLRLIAHELTHVIQQANSSAPPAIYRQVGPEERVSRRRIVYLDNDVIGAVVDGNKVVADALLAMRASGTDIRMSRYNYVETSHGEPIRAGARKLVIEKFRITIDEGGGLSSRAGTYIELSSGKPASIQPKDVPVLAAVRAAEPEAELWTLDGGPKENATRFGVKLAPESALKHAPQLDYRVGLKNVGLGDYEIAADGTPIRRMQSSTNNAAPSSMASSIPSHEPIKGIPKGGRTNAEPATSEHTGRPLEPVSEATPGYEPERGEEIGNSIQLLQGKQFSNLQESEIDKFNERSAALQPKIDAFLAKGYSVELVLIVEQPKTPDVLCGTGAFCDQDQLVYFHSLYISYVESMKPVATHIDPNVTPQTGMSYPNHRPGFHPYPHQGGSLIEDNEIPFLSTRDPLHRCVSIKSTVYPP